MCKLLGKVSAPISFLRLDMPPELGLIQSALPGLVARAPLPEILVAGGDESWSNDLWKKENIEKRGDAQGYSGILHDLTGYKTLPHLAGTCHHLWRYGRSMDFRLLKLPSRPIRSINLNVRYPFHEAMKE